jgi:ketosteroid isomerase-like protein
MGKTLAAIAAVLIAANAAASPRDNILGAVQKFDDAFNKGDSAGIVGSCTDDAIIIDDFAPHVWQGAKACSVWLNDYGADATANGIADGIVKIGKPWQALVTGDRGYVVVPARYTYTQHGKPVVETGSVWTLALHKVGGLWKISGWAWAQH